MDSAFWHPDERECAAVLGAVNAKPLRVPSAALTARTRDCKKSHCGRDERMGFQVELKDCRYASMGDGNATPKRTGVLVNTVVRFQ